ncbi:MAG: hypothetical protein KAX49_13865 [Halanaerobiales bacterium]|nr:hypothetical protein [Halanaerobiales bacterium]
MGKRKGCLWLIIAIIFTAISPLAYASEGQVVQSVVVHLKDSEENVIHPRIKDRIESSITKVAEKVLINQEIAVIKKNRKEISQLIKSVFEKVLVGYIVIDFGFIVGEETGMIVELKPTSTLIEEVNLDLEILKIDERIVQIVDKEIAVIKKNIENYLLGFPIESLIWADDIIKPLIENLIEWQLPGFAATLEIEIGSTIKVGLVLEPVGKLVRDIQVEVNTHSFPRLLILPIQEHIEESLAIFQGLPVEFLNKYKDRLTDAAYGVIDGSNWARNLYWNSEPEIIFDTVTHLYLDVNWIDSQIDFKGELNLGLRRLRLQPVFELYFGKIVGPHTMVSLKDRIILDKWKNDWSLGLEYYLNSNWTIATEYQIQDFQWKGIVDWHNSQYGITVSKIFSGNIDDFRLAFNYYYKSDTQISLIYEDDNAWISLQQGL